ncbi:MAG: hypothetical protein C3F15_08860 [Holophagae bacterium]|nr:MAG: hypothetical protein C3F15_08860 [Holophagae bacterium]
MTRRSIIGCVLVAVVVAGACDLLNPARPAIQGDTTLFGNLLEVDRIEGADEAWQVRMRIGVPRALAKAEAAGGQPTPTLEEGLVADVRVTTDTVVLVDGAPFFIEDVNPGTEIVVLPVAGTTRMVGTSNITVDASYLTDFTTYRRWQLPGLPAPEGEVDGRRDPARINSAGVEHAPVPVGDGSVLYFAAHLRPPKAPGEAWLGALRDGLAEPSSGTAMVERSYRTQLTAAGWTAPALVRFPELDDAALVRVSWVSDDETSCLVTVAPANGPSWIGRSARPSADASWGALEVVEAFGSDNVDDGVYLAGSASKIVFTANWAGNPQTDLVLFDPGVSETPQLLTPPINTAASEWGARVGPRNELLFVRDDRQLALIDGTVQQVRIPSPHRAVITEVAPTRDGAWVFLCRPSYQPVEVDQDIWVARWVGGGRLGEPVPVDDWHP